MGSYKPTLDDIPTTGYKPSINDLPGKQNVAENISNQANLQGEPPDKSLSEMYEDFMNPNKADSKGRPLSNTFLGGMPNPNYSDVRQNMMMPKPMTDEDAKKAAGVMTMALAPEFPIAPLIPKAIESILPTLSGGTKIAADYLSSIGKTGAGIYAGSRMIGENPTHAGSAAATGSAITAATTPFTMALSSMNPMVRLVAGGGLGSMMGYYGSQMIDGNSSYGTGVGGIVGALAGLRGAGAKELAAKNAYDAMTPDNMNNAINRTNASRMIGVPLDLAEASGSPVIGEMRNAAATSSAGSKVLYPWGLKRAKLEENSIQDFLNTVSPPNAKNTIEDRAFRSAFDNAENSGLRINVKPVIDKIDSELPKYEEGSKIATALNTAKDRLAMTPATREKYEKLFSPVVNMEKMLQTSGESLAKQISEMESNAPNSYFRSSSNYDAKLQDLKNQFVQNQNSLNLINHHKQMFMQRNNINPYENTLEGLHNAKLGIRGVMEGQGDKAIGNVAAGKLKQVNKQLNNILTNQSPEYANANNISNMRQARQDLEEAMTKSQLSGSNFYDKVLSNKIEYNKLYQRLADPKAPKVPSSAQIRLDAMHTAFPDLITNLTSKSGRALAESTPEVTGGIGGLMKSFINKVYMDRYNKAVAELIINPRWHDELMQVAKMKAGEDRGIALGRLIAKTGVVSGTVQHNIDEQGSNNDGDNFKQ